MKGARMAALGAGLVVAAGVGLVLRGFGKAHKFIHFPRSPVTAAAEVAAVAEFPKLEDIRLETSDRVKLVGWFVPGERRAAVILVHGGGNNRTELLAEARIVRNHGYGFLVYDSRASGESEGDVVTWGDAEQRDLTAALDYVSARPDVDPQRIAVLGFSIGASTVAMTAARDPRPRAVILEATWTSLTDEIKHKVRNGPLSWWPTLWGLRAYGITPENVRPLEVIRAIHPRPLLMIAGEVDEDTPVSVMQQIFDAAAEPKELWVVPDGRHGTCAAVAPVAFESRLVAFLDRALMGERSAR